MKSFKAWILDLFTPLQKLMQRFGRDETVITKDIVDDLLRAIQPGDILLSHEKQRFTSLFIKGFYDHAAIVSHKYTVIEAVGDKWKRINGVLTNLGGVREMALEEWLYKKDFVAVIRVKNMEYLDRYKVANLSRGYIGRNYDYVFSRDNKSIYCSELVLLCYLEVWKDFLAEIPDDKEVLPQMYLDLCKQVDYLECIRDTRSQGLADL